MKPYAAADSEPELPGKFPYTRGLYQGMYRGRHWTMRQFAGFGTAEENNTRYQYLFGQGTTAFALAFDLPTQMGMDSDHPLAAGEVGRAGVAIDSVADMEALFRDIPLDKVSTSMTINATAAIPLAFYVAAARRQGVAPQRLTGAIQNDILSEYVARGTYIYPLAPAMRIVTDLIAWTATEMPAWNPVAVNGHRIREAGCTAIQEVAFSFANAFAYIEAAIAAGLHVDNCAPRLSFFFSSHRHFLKEIAKFRAARRLYAVLMRDRFGARNEKSMMLRFHAQTAVSTLTAQQPGVNEVRTSLEALSAVLGGAQSLQINGRNEALSPPTEESARLALRTQQILAYESGIANTADPVGGSLVIERMTDEIEAGAIQILEEIDAMGGTLRAIEEGWIQNQIQNSAFALQREIESGRRVIVGVNRFRAKDETDIATFRLDPELEREQIDRLREVRAGRAQAATAAAMKRLTEAARDGANLMPHIVNAAEESATLGEISDALRLVFGEYAEASY